jgi:HK97 family phage major capsid protein
MTYTDYETERVLAEARAIPGGHYPSGRTDDSREAHELERMMAEVQAAHFGSKFASAMASELKHFLQTGRSSKALVADSAGAIILPPDISVDIATVAREVGTIRSLAQIRPVNDIKHRAGLLAAASVGWGKLETGTSITDAAMSVLSPALDIDVHDVMALAQIGVDELADAPEAVRASIVEAIGIAIGEAEDTAYAAGTGTNQPKGLTLAANVTRVPAGQKITAAASATPVLADVLALPWKLPTRYRRNAVWLMSEDAAPKIAALTYANGSGIMPNAGQGLGPLGYPFYVVPGLPSMATAGVTDPSVWFINLPLAYRVVDRGPITLQRLTQRYAEVGLVGMLVKRRCGGDLLRPDAAAIYLL